MSQVISFCLFGSDPMFCRGAIANADLMPKVYPGWEMLVFYGGGSPESTIADLEKRGAKVVACPGANPMIERFTAAELPGYERFLVRDCDSRINSREKAAVDAWIESGEKFHVMRDHPHHEPVISGGMWGGMCGVLPIRQLILKWAGNKGPGTREVIYNNDQLFLRDCVWPLIKGDCLEHDSCLRHIYRNALPFPESDYDPLRFVGERFTADNEPETYGWQQRLNHVF